ncbi:MAG TPA: hypothetical protein DEF51_46395, partial [Myxococcales bacterium]|nr:hypothetical protein [Myxococcales bacterium]
RRSPRYAPRDRGAARDPRAGARAARTVRRAAAPPFEVGTWHYETGDYRDAIREFERALELSQRSRLYDNLAACHEHLGELTQAADYLERFINASPPVSRDVWVSGMRLCRDL